ncbi:MULTISPECIES: DUF1684 domain-containing protein [unclassified Microbacterium]|uniref:DUF1684 domain-containing protein n=2 Tax=Microbacterium TaxID=33882 RepID=UPI000CFCB85C|nr:MULTISPECIES: DUF1684 domain-containing protein [unclassified Microbacterium]PQZ60088.1 hypothetical protein CQ032_04565 [Microbacterium sp. MYb43]PQZ79566.1 hypothetical protein CQ031_08855 [Microbacterium sp. MYb40]PRB23131.1 hypothetical protein CQ040_03165 [Microbacterium sp. MYb54]PRB27592.1 hypothetical protein CQ037_10930 [Microbacterium sp. MYb50]PRB65883.1 hypothetical protein CQ021_13270 [Microbacterium sp. MYb24]
MSITPARTAVEVVDWRRRVFALYDAVRIADSPEEAHELWRIERDDLMLRHPATPLLPEDRALFEGLPIASYDPAWRFELPILPAEPGGFEFATGTDGIVPFERIGKVEIPDAGSLDVWRLKSYGGGLFIPVRDALAGRPGGTYGGGRYLIDTVKGADLGSDSERGTIVLDFNFAYNPSCAYDPAWACPLAQPGNVLPVVVPVGEMYGVDAG